MEDVAGAPSARTRQRPHTAQRMSPPRTIFDRKPSTTYFETVGMIGQGGYAVVRVVKDTRCGRVFALKQLAKVDLAKQQASRLRSEIEALYLAAELTAARRIRALGAGVTAAQLLDLLYCTPDFVPRLYYCWQDEAFVYLLQEFLPGGDLMKHLIDMDVFPEWGARLYTAQIVQGIQYCHETLGFAHRDVKPDNILLDAQGRLKIVDLGLSTHVGKATVKGTRIQYPERLKSDVLRIIWLQRCIFADERVGFLTGRQTGGVWVLSFMRCYSVDHHYLIRIIVLIKRVA
ncbi:MAG: LOW QUALITY PROTEIN: hypothetical protein KVP17_000277 [Porospora cf. gigantea B]|uniref:uncharacterized protein n=1 Tax=Porospora cf. gigantea B TaxID=2853592 RepID=UPI003571F77C|nr:MAG: LOW QUALITY PROTEIN: hypothetical protein KVP17_000277 [Porospora cf. gigantea B]